MTSGRTFSHILRYALFLSVICFTNCRSVYFEGPMPGAADTIEQLPDFFGYMYEVLPATEEGMEEMEQAPVYDRQYLLEFKSTGEGKGVVHLYNYISHQELDKTHEDIDIKVGTDLITFTTPDTVLTYAGQRIPTGYIFNSEVFRVVDLQGGNLTDEEGGDSETCVLKRKGNLYYINRLADEHWELDLFEITDNGDILWYEVDEDHFKENVGRYRAQFKVTDLEDNKYMVHPSDAHLETLIAEGTFFHPWLHLRRMQVQ